MNQDFEMESMRQQMATLKSKLNSQEMLNDRLMRRSMKSEVNTINRRYFIIMAVCIFMIPYGYWCFVKLSGLSIAFWIATSVIMLICASATFYNSRKINDPGLMSHSLVEARKKVASAKKFDSDWLLFGIPMIIVWLGWFFYETYQQNHDFANGIFWGGVVGGVIGAFAGFSIHFRTQRQYQEIIDQIEDLTAEE
jgi:membrane associated rhomboid family serine protease